MNTGGTQIWQGACHCHRTRFTITADIDHSRICDCSICHQRGALIFRAEEDQFTLHTSLSDMTLYEWGTGTAKDNFCKTCGILPFRRPRVQTADEAIEGLPVFSGWAINARCLEGLDVSQLPIQHIWGSRLSLPD